MKQGQALVIVLLILAVASALGLSAVSRSVNEVNLSVTQDDSSQALSAAESGIEAVLKQNLAGTPLPTGSSGNVGSYGSYKVSNTAAIGNTTTVEVSNSLASGETAPLFLKQPDISGNFVDTSGNLVAGASYAGANYLVCWGRSGAPDPKPALEVTTYSRTGLNAYARVFTVFEAGTGRVTGGTAAINATSCPADYAYQNTVSVPAGALLANFRMLYISGTGQPVFVNSQSANTFPPQGNTYEIEGTAGETTRRISVIETYPAPLGILDNALFSGTNL